jgi:hypothetical protein
MSDEICECGHSKSAHYFAEGEPGHCVLACECTQFRSRKEVQKKCYRCGHTKEEHHRVGDDGGGVLWFCRVRGCSCDHFIGNATDYIRSTQVAAVVIPVVKMRVAFARFVAVLDPWYDAGLDPTAWPRFDVRINPEDVSSIFSTEYPGFVQVSMRNKQIFRVQGTVDEVQKKLQEA